MPLGVSYANRARIALETHNGSIKAKELGRHLGVSHQKAGTILRDIGWVRQISNKGVITYVRAKK